MDKVQKVTELRAFTVVDFFYAFFPLGVFTGRAAFTWHTDKQFILAVIWVQYELFKQGIFNIFHLKLIYYEGLYWTYLCQWYVEFVL